MPIYSLEEYPNDADREFDLLIVGSGPAGLTVARELRDSELKIAILESGNFDSSSDTSSLNEFISIGHRRAPPGLVRHRGVGGSSTLWTGRCGIFDPIDFQERAWLPLSGWPIDLDEIQPFLARSGVHLGLADYMSARHTLRDLKQGFDEPEWDSDFLEPVLWQFSRGDGAQEIRHFSGVADPVAEELTILQHSGAPESLNFGTANAHWLKNSKDVHLVINATITEVVTNQDGRQVRGVIACTMDNQKRQFTGRAVVLAGGGIDNARLLLTSRSVFSNGIGNQHNQVGRYLCDHTFTELGSYGFDEGKALRRRFGSRFLKKQGNAAVYSSGVRLSAEVQYRERLLNVSAHPAEFGSDLNALSSLAAGVRGLRNGRNLKQALVEVAAGLGRPTRLAEGLIDRCWHGRPQLNSPNKTIIGCVVEQPLQFDSRIKLSDQLDRFDMDLSRFSSDPITRLGCFSFEGQWTFSVQC